MVDYLWPLVFFALWFVLNRWLLPRMGVQT